jgi:geranylgeranyl transferase type-2 subunit beta
MYLDLLEEAHRVGLRGLSDAFADTQVRFVRDSQQSDGGFRGRQGGSDLYYSDFALRSLAILAPDDLAFDRAAGYLSRQVRRPRSVVESFSILSMHRMLGSRGGRLNLQNVLAVLRAHLLAGGGIVRSAENPCISAYSTFLGALCYEMLGEAMPTIDGAVGAVERLGRSDGGFAELEGQSASQTSATAAAVAFLAMQGALSPEYSGQAVHFLRNMQSADGGFAAHAGVAAGDLLSTFTGLTTLAALDGLHAIDVPGGARFLRNTARAVGGFLACVGDDGGDVEYTYCGLGVLAQLRMLRTEDGDVVAGPS